MSRDSCNHLLELISGHSTFNETQDPIKLQLAVTLYRLGTYGNGSSVTNVSTKFGISIGAVVKYTDRVIDAITSLSKRYIYWPGPSERQDLGRQMALQCLPKCIGFVDGTDIVFDEAPHDDKELYWSRKKKYCIQAQIICDIDRKIRDLFTGYPGSVHDAKAFSKSPIAIVPNKFFSAGEFIIGDSAYAISENVITPYKRGVQGITPERKAFNRHLSSHRVLVENTIGLLKSRFQSLKSLRIRVSKKSGHAKVYFDEECQSNEVKSRRGNLKREALFHIFKTLQRNN
ncbi:putative nuclease HARBI1 [Orchesella cincta]|uniref:Putative nuclease HARBI1 n=1 Tax=Orchesella cincta TaxID=48709 RepID=A0A1D2M2B6_ORCCI|nr:putative nuclease HARBI1 [Orchesella cincta]